MVMGIGRNALILRSSHIVLSYPRYTRPSSPDARLWMSMREKKHKRIRHVSGSKPSGEPRSPCGELGGRLPS